MLKLFRQERRTGKTTKVVGLLENSPNALLVIPIGGMRDNYKALGIKNKIVTISDVVENRVDLLGYSMVIIDEGFLSNKLELAKLYYVLGKTNTDVIVYGTFE